MRTRQAEGATNLVKPRTTLDVRTHFFLVKTVNSLSSLLEKKDGPLSRTLQSALQTTLEQMDMVELCQKEAGPERQQLMILTAPEIGLDGLMEASSQVSEAGKTYFYFILMSSVFSLSSSLKNYFPLISICTNSTCHKACLYERYKFLNVAVYKSLLQNLSVHETVTLQDVK